MAKQAFSFKTDGPNVEYMYSTEGKSVSTIAKQLGRGYETIKNYLTYKGLYTGPILAKGGVSRGIAEVPEIHEMNTVYYSLRHKANAKFRGYYKGACRIFVIEDLYCAYCKPEELIQIKKQKEVHNV